MKRYQTSSSSSSANRTALIALLGFVAVSLIVVFWALNHQEQTISGDHHHHLLHHHDNNKEDSDHFEPSSTIKQQDKENGNHHHGLSSSSSSSSSTSSKIELSETAKCMIKKIHASSLTIKAIGSYPIGTYVCSYLFPNDKAQQKSCTVQCPLKDPHHHDSHHKNRKHKSVSSSSISSSSLGIKSAITAGGGGGGGGSSNGAAVPGKFFSCQIREKARSKSEASSATDWDLMFFHYGAPPVIPDPQRQLVVFYSGESNITEAKRAKADYQSKFSHVVSCHHSRRFYFTWTARHVADFNAIANKALKIRLQIENKFNEEKKQKQQQKQDDGGGGKNGDGNSNHNNAEGITTELSTLVAEHHRREWHHKIDAAVIFITRCGKGGRDTIIEALRTNGIPVHSFGKCQRTHILKKEHPECVGGGGARSPSSSSGIVGGAVAVDPSSPSSSSSSKKGIDRYAEKLCVFRKYRYVLALENSAEEDYVTEKLYHGLIAGAIPIYLGSPNVDDFVPLPGSSYIPLSRYYKGTAPSVSSAVASEDYKKIDFDIRSDPKSNLNFDKMKQDFEKLDQAGSERALGNREESAGTYWLDSLLEWRRAESVDDFGVKNPKFWENLYHEEPTCDLCNLALQRKCEPGA